jgi:hypothetical protein
MKLTDISNHGVHIACDECGGRLTGGTYYDYNVGEWVIRVQPCPDCLHNAHAGESVLDKDKINDIMKICQDILNE